MSVLRFEPPVHITWSQDEETEKARRQKKRGDRKREETARKKERNQLYRETACTLCLLKSIHVINMCLLYANDLTSKK